MASPVATSQKVDSNRGGNAPSRSLSRADKRIRPSSRGARWDRGPNHRAGVPLTTSAPAAPWSVNPRMSQINEFLGQPRNDSPCAAVEFWRGSLSQGRNLSYAQTLDSGEWLMGSMGCTRMVWLCDRFWVEIRQGRSRPGGPS